MHDRLADRPREELGCRRGLHATLIGSATRNVITAGTTIRERGDSPAGAGVRAEARRRRDRDAKLVVGHRISTRAKPGTFQSSAATASFQLRSARIGARAAGAGGAGGGRARARVIPSPKSSPTAARPIQGSTGIVSARVERHNHVRQLRPVDRRSAASASVTPDVAGTFSAGPNGTSPTWPSSTAGRPERMRFTCTPGTYGEDGAGGTPDRRPRPLPPRCRRGATRAAGTSVRKGDRLRRPRSIRSRCLTCPRHGSCTSCRGRRFVDERRATDEVIVQARRVRPPEWSCPPHSRRGRSQSRSSRSA